MKNRKIGITGILLAVVLSGTSIQRADAQLGDNDSSINYLAMQIGASAGISADNYQRYAEKLAKTMGHLNSDQQATIFGFVPTPTGSTQSASSPINGNPISAQATSGSNSGGGSTSGGDQSTGSGTDSSPSNWWEGLKNVVKNYFEAREPSGSQQGGDGNNGHGNDSSGVDPSNPGKGNSGS